MANNFVEPAQHDTQTCSVHPEEQPGTSAAGLISVSDDPPTSQPSKMNVKRSADMENIREYHTQMIEELGDLFSRKQWRSICNKVKMKKYVSTKDMDDVESMEDLCIALERKGIIEHGEYSRLRAILVTFDVEAGKIIDDFTRKIRQEMEGPSPARQPRMEEQSTDAVNMTFTCDVCGRSDFKTEGGMKGHRTKMHSNDQGSTAHRLQSNDRGSQAQRLQSNGQGSSGQRGSPKETFTCDISGKSDFKTEGGMKGHKTKVHSNDQGSPAQRMQSNVGGSPAQRMQNIDQGSPGHRMQSNGQGSPAQRTQSNDPGSSGQRGSTKGFFTCDICGKDDFKTEGGMKGHKSKMHSNYQVSPAHKMQSNDRGSPAQRMQSNDQRSPRQRMQSNDRGSAQQNNDNVIESKGGRACVQEAEIPHSHVMNENCIRLNNENPRASGSVCATIPKEYKNVIPHDISDDQHVPRRDVSSPTPRLNNPGGYLSQRMESAKLRLNDINKAAGIVKDFIEGDHRFRKTLNNNGGGFLWDILTSGSYYDKTKNMSPDEFDFMISPMNLDAQMIWNKDMPKGFCKIALRGTGRGELMTGPYLDPGKFKQMAFKLFGDAAASRNVTRKKKDMDSPAYTILYNPGGGQTEIDIDLVPSIEIKGWPKPECCRNVAPKWINDDYFLKKCMERYHVVAKTCPDTDYPEDERKLLWRMSFSAAEKHLIFHANRGNDKSIRKPIFRFLKTLLEETKNENEGKIKKLCSYHLKMFMLHQFDSWPNDTDDASHKRDSCMHILSLLERILQQNPSYGFPRIDNYFLKGDNVIRHVPKHETELFRMTLKSELDKIK